LKDLEHPFLVETEEEEGMNKGRVEERHKATRTLGLSGEIELHESFWGFHGGDISSQGLLGCDAMQCCGRIS
jgi:hypothetical protein